MDSNSKDNIDKQLSPTRLTDLKGAGEQLAKKLNKLGIYNTLDLLFHLPIRYIDKTQLSPIKNILPGNRYLVLGQINTADIRFGKRRNLLISVNDDSGHLSIRLFHFSKKQQQKFKQGAWIRCYGEVRCGPQSLEMVHPEYQIFATKPTITLEKNLTPVYPAIEGIGTNTILKLVKQILKPDSIAIRDIFSQTLQQKLGLMPLEEALLAVHQPPTDIDTAALLQGIHPAQQRLALEELLAHHLAFSEVRKRRQAEVAPPIITKQDASWWRLKQNLPFSLTTDQIKVIDEIFDDISKSSPCLRLVQGDVGSGKTIVAAAAALVTIDSGYQVALMAPTELLADQHLRNFKTWLEPLNIQLAGVTKKLNKQSREQTLENIRSGKTKMVIGTHALFQEKTQFHNLALLIVDEQHRFGVNQRLALKNKSNLINQTPHQLIMSATPIPRSIAMIFYADLDVSNIKQLPPNRKPVHTAVIPDSRRYEVAQRIRCVCQSGQQAYWVCPLIDESEGLQAQAATETCDNLKQQIPDIRIGLVHGRMISKDKESIMQAFSEGEIDLLIATTVVEVGVDVTNATLMIIENSERLGLAQLHQLRGRIGRGKNQSSCILLYRPPLGRIAKQRLGILRESNDGFFIAQKDLEHRGPGELLGTRQTGLQKMRIARLPRDNILLSQANQIAQDINNNYPQLINPLLSRWISHNDQYANV